MRIVVVGGKLQGTEAVYLAHQAGWETILVDRSSNVPAAGMCDEVHQMDIGQSGSKLVEVFKRGDLIIPAVEDQSVLEHLSKAAAQANVPLAYDPSAYYISASKRRSDRMLAEHAIPAPAYWPKCKLPIIAKPSGGSGSQGVIKIDDSDELAKFIKHCSNELENWVMQEYLEGPSFSLEVIGCQGNYLTFQTTDLEMDDSYDCKRVLAPTALKKPLETEFREIAVRIAKAINLKGIMDVEIIKSGNSLKVLEIDARLPSQTPTVVLKSTGVNMLEVLGQVFLKNTLKALPKQMPEKAVIYEHISVSRLGIENLGEHIMAGVEKLKYHTDLFGCDEAITNYNPGRESWVATLIITGSDSQDVLRRRQEVITNISKHLYLTDFTNEHSNNGKFLEVKHG